MSMEVNIRSRSVACHLGPVCAFAAPYQDPPAELPTSPDQPGFPDRGGARHLALCRAEFPVRTHVERADLGRPPPRPGALTSVQRGRELDTGNAAPRRGQSNASQLS